MPTRPQRTRPQPQDAFNHFARLSADQQLAVVLTFSDHLDESRLRTAISALLCEQPVLDARFSYLHGKARFIAGGSSDRLSVRSAWDAEAAALDAASQPLDYVNDGVMCVDLIRDATADALVLRIDHVAADGQGAKQVAALLASRYADPSPGDAGTTVQGVPDRSGRRLLRQFPLGEKLAAIRSRRSVRPAWGLPVTGADAGRRHHAIASLEADAFTSLRSHAKEFGATVNDLVLAAFYRALFDELDSPVGAPMALNVSFDMRRYLNANDPMPVAANLSSTETAMLRRVRGEDFAGTLARAVAEMRVLKVGHPGLGSAVLLEYAGVLGYHRIEKLATEPMRRGREHGVSFPFLSNFGILDADALTYGDLTPTQAVMLPPVGHPPFMMLSPSTYAGRLSLAIGYAEGETDPALIHRLLDRVIGDLSAWSATQGQSALATTSAP
jgi:NRPS condensation-like uncharacterized protein